jgi:nucleotide-binding universal stress UspA family protein
VTYATLMVHLDLGHSNAGLLQATGDLAERFRADVIGVAGCEPIQVIYSDGNVPGDVIERDHKQIESEIKEAEARFRGALESRVRSLEWRSRVVIASLSDYVAREARSADLIITGADRGGSLFDTSRCANTSDLVMRVGRPVLVVPAAAHTLNPVRVVVGWKETRETRRAIFDALPILKRAAHVVIVEIAADAELAAARTRLEDVISWLKRHGVVSEPIALRSTGDDAERLDGVAQEQGADLVVAGAYGHSRLREWVLGGVTRDLLLCSDRCSLLSH